MVIQSNGFINIDLVSLRDELNTIAGNSLSETGLKITMEKNKIDINGTVYEINKEDISLLQMILEYKAWNPDHYYDHIKYILDEIFTQISQIIQEREKEDTNKDESESGIPFDYDAYKNKSLNTDNNLNSDVDGENKNK